MTDELHPNIGGRVFFNPGTGPVSDRTPEQAAINMGFFLDDCRIAGLTCKRVPEHDYGDGRYAFLVCRAGYEPVEIQMPGRAIDRVRFTGAADQNIWDYPRLYVDGSSWVWMYALLNHESFIPLPPPTDHSANYIAGDFAAGSDE